MYETVKRLFDVVSSLIAIIILSPLFVFIIIGIKLSSKGPVFYKSDRIGRNRETFVMYKFRTMHIKSEDAVESKYLVNQDRIFKFGDFLRKSKMDELPQLLNILKGDMSVVGPRPYGAKFTGANYVGKNEIILSVRPGLACFDSLFDYTHGDLFVADEEKYRRIILPIRTELAGMYVEKRGFIIDSYCIMRTFLLIFEIVVLNRKKFKLTVFEREAWKRTRKAAKEK